MKHSVRASAVLLLGCLWGCLWGCFWGCHVLLPLEPYEPVPFADAGLDRDGEMPAEAAVVDGDTPGPDGAPPIDIQDIAVGGAHVCALKGDGVLKCWGWNDWGFLGVGDEVSRSVPTVAASELDIRDVEAGVVHTCALTTTNGEQTVHCWGYGLWGNLGQGKEESSSSPVMAPLANVTHLAVGHRHTCVIAGGTTQCWGTNYWGLGDGSTKESVDPVTVDLPDKCAPDRLVSGRNNRQGNMGIFHPKCPWTSRRIDK